MHGRRAAENMPLIDPSFRPTDNAAGDCTLKAIPDGVAEQRTVFRTLSGFTALSVAILILAGRFTPQIMPDTPGYLRIVGYPAMLLEPRTPLYGWIVTALDFGGSSHLAVPVFQVATYVAAVGLLVGQLRRYGLSLAATLSVGAGLLLANAFLIDANWIHPELLSITCGILAVAATIALADVRASRWAWALLCAGAGCAKRNFESPVIQHANVVGDAGLGRHAILRGLFAQAREQISAPDSGRKAGVIVRARDPGSAALAGRGRVVASRSLARRNRRRARG